MTIKNAIKKLEKNGFTATNRGQSYTAKKAGSRLIEFYRNGRSEDVTCIRIRRESDHDDSMTDYCAGSWCDTITEAIRRA